MKAENATKNAKERPPVVVVMGHVDHGKTTLLDYIKKTSVAAREAGGITQSIGAYEITHGEKRITFIDTPGHEAFGKMRGRGAHVADLAILVVAADDGVKPQTKEVIQILERTKTPFVVAINKIDKPGVDINKTKNDLTSHNVLLEGYGGNISWQGISAKTGEGVDELLDLVLLVAELENLTYEPSDPARGVIIEAKRDPRRGNEVMAIIMNGTLKVGDAIATETAHGKVKVLENFLGKKEKELTPSSPALIMGFEALPQAGEEFWVGEKKETEPSAKKTKRTAAAPSTKQDDKNTLKLIVSADVHGSLEAFLDLIKSIPTPEVKIEIIDEGIGEITDSHIRLAASFGALIIGFRTKASSGARTLALAQHVKIITSDIIYELVKKIEEEAELIKKPAPKGVLEILATFSQKGSKQLVGGKVASGTIKNKTQVTIRRNEQEIGRGKIVGLQHNKQDVTEVTQGKECGLMLDSDTTLEKGDMLIIRA